MPTSHRLLALGLVTLVFFGFLKLPVTEITVAESQTGSSVDDGRPKLVVLVAFDQFRGDYLDRWESLYGEGGFKRLTTEGAHFTNCHYPYAYTLTAPGHASLSTGTYPAKHGIIANDWYDRANAQTVSSVTPPPEKKSQGSGPYRRAVRSIGDVLLDVLAGRSRVFSFSIKDRSAILLAAKKAQAVYWFNDDLGRFVTSPFYRETDPAFVKAFNKSKIAERWIGKDWTKFRTDIDYAAYSGPDDFFAEGTGYGQGRTFPHPTMPNPEQSKSKKPLLDYYEAMENSPYGNELLLELAKSAIVAEKLGQTKSTDLLCVSFSSNDLVGHCYGPDSQEVLDITLRSDKLMKDFLDFLDAKVGKGKYVIAMSADHGVCPLPEFASRQGKDAGRAAPEVLTSLAEAHLNEAFLTQGKKVAWFEVPNKYNAWVYLNRGTMKSLGLDSSKVERSLADWMSKQPGILTAITRADVTAPPRPDDSKILQQVRKSFRPESSGDVMAILEPYHLFSPALLSKDPDKIKAFRTSHGTPHSYDTWVPLVVMGPNIRPGKRDDLVAPQSMAAILSRALKIEAPNGDEFPVPKGLFAE